MKYFVPAGRITNKGMPQRERKCFVVKKTVWKLFAPALCAAVLFAACSKDDSSSSRPQSVSTPPASSSVPPASASSQPASSSSAASSEAASSVPASSSAASSSAAATPTQSTRRGATVRADGGLRLRASASEKSEKLLTIPDGTHIECTGWQSGWAKTTYEGKTGYVSAVYLLYDGKVRADGGLRLRSGPGESYEKLLTVPDGTVLPCISQGDGWVKTTYNGTPGYGSPADLLVPVTVRASTGLNLRASASETAEKLLTIPNGTVVQCYGNKENEWARVAYNGKAGYVSYLYIAYD